eukprot:CAMPEP_0171215144 /NCGR_PEP_ID=MMETSP0790-20130122/31517_1 /TAXON_ID=2925 /ORGANISM="Alexandrium catenella, Strain OF101" /LENGTH=257 /DNA_ID=CAMNT_0011680891 /DNA_START=68 /DNA_END=839 /DNA_ORIENTATION=-
MAEGLIGSVKMLQRSDQKAKEQWWAYCDSLGGAVRDPAKHPEDFLQTFLDNFRAGNRFEPADGAAAAVLSGGGYGGGATGGGNPLAQLCKEGQKKSHSWKEAWATYCLAHGNGKNDPEKHDNYYIVGFLDHVAGCGIAALSGASPEAGGLGMPAAKRARTAGGPAAFGGGFGGGASGDPEKDGLVGKIKAFQRSSPDAKEIWGAYCDAHLGGIRDPNRHDKDVLMQFVSDSALRERGEREAAEQPRAAGRDGASSCR